MNVLIVGKSDINEALEQRLCSEGFSADIVSDCSAVVRLKGRPGAYELIASKKKYTGAGVIVTEQAYTGDSELFEAQALNLLAAGTVEKLLAVQGRKKAAILLDYLEETPEWLTALAYEASIRLANAKKDVLFLSMFSKAASTGMEKLYLKARQAGVTFVKYERASAEFKGDSGVFIVKVNDGVIDTVVETPYLITTGIRDDSALAYLSGKFRVSDKKEIAGEFKYFLNPALTTRKGVYYIHNNLDAAVPYIVNELKEIAADMEHSGAQTLAMTGDKEPKGDGSEPKGDGSYGSVNEPYEPSPFGFIKGFVASAPRYPLRGTVPVVDSGKCAFCYSCYRACPHAALEPDIEAGAMVCVENACQACGVCVAICPGEAIVLDCVESAAQTLAMTGDMEPKGDGSYGSVNEPYEPSPFGSASEAKQSREHKHGQDGKTEGGAVCKVFCCENSAGPAFQEIAKDLGTDAGKLCLTEIPCGGRLGFEQITEALATYEKVLVAVCIDGACRHMNGGKRACKQVLRTAAELEKAGLDGTRVRCLEISHAMPKVLLENVKSFLDDKQPEKK